MLGTILIRCASVRTKSTKEVFTPKKAFPPAKITLQPREKPSQQGSSTQKESSDRLPTRSTAERSYVSTQDESQLESNEPSLGPRKIKDTPKTSESSSKHAHHSEETKTAPQAKRAKKTEGGVRVSTTRREN